MTRCQCLINLKGDHLSKFVVKMIEGESLLTTINREISANVGRSFKGNYESSGMGGGGGASVGVIKDPSTNEAFFYKSSGLMGYNMLQAEYIGIKEMYDTHTIRVPKPICYGTSSSNSYVVFERLSLGGVGSSKRYAEELAAMHKKTSDNGCYGFHINNTIGATFQPNTWETSWAEFYDKHRLGHMFTLCRRDGLVFTHETLLRKRVYNLLAQHPCVPSLVHGDLWSGNQAYTKEGDPVIFDPATYYGDREVDIAMTKLFGSNSKAFYDAYDTVWPRPQGWELREIIYNLYHMLNHYVLFGGGYGTQAGRMVDQIIAATTDND